MTNDFVTDARPATLGKARIIYALLKGAFENSGYTVYMGGSTLVYGTGRDIDILFLRQTENAIRPPSILNRLRDFGFLDEILHVNNDEWGVVGLMSGLVVDITVLGWPNE